MPGKCFIEGTVSPASSPDANASESEAVVDALKDHVRPCWYMKELVDQVTSATGARSLLIPAHSSATPVALPCANAVEVLPDAPMDGGEMVGAAQPRRLTV